MVAANCRPVGRRWHSGAEQRSDKKAGWAGAEWTGCSSAQQVKLGCPACRSMHCLTAPHSRASCPPAAQTHLKEGGKGDGGDRKAQEGKAKGVKAAAHILDHHLLKTEGRRSGL